MGGHHTISIHALREEGDFGYLCSEQLFRISIHALREEGDRSTDLIEISPFRISIHALREEGDVPASSSLIA